MQSLGFWLCALLAILFCLPVTYVLELFGAMFRSLLLPNPLLGSALFNSEQDLDDLKSSHSPFGPFLHKISQHYMKYHKDSYAMNGMQRDKSPHFCVFLPVFLHL